MTLIISDPIFLDHKTGSHPESPQRLANIMEKIGPLTIKQETKMAPFWQKIHDPFLEGTHSKHQLSLIAKIAAAGGGQVDEDTILSPASWQVAQRAAASGIMAVDSLLTTNQTQALCLVRPPGHHATDKKSMGFCLINNIAVTAEYCIRHYKMSRIAILDFDVHHGNGTQDIFYQRPDVLFVSLHRSPFYPGTGQLTETGSGQGLGATANFPIEMGTSRASYLDTLRKGLEKVIQFKPDILLISAGFDAHKDDPIGSLGLETEDFKTIGAEIKNCAESICQGRIISLLEGGYNITALEDSIAAYLVGQDT